MVENPPSFVVPPSPVAGGEPMEQSAERTALASLVHHRTAIAHDLPLEDVHRNFRERSVDYFALVRDGRVTGICSRARVGFLLGSRFGFALNSRSPAHAAQVAHPIVVTRETPVRWMLDQALGRPADEFHEDVVLVDDHHALIGLISVQVLARLQSRLVNEQLGALRLQHEAMSRQHETSHRQNLELFQANQALRQAQGLYRGLFESNAIGIALLDVNGEVQAHNRRLAELLGRGPAAAGTFSLAALVTEREQPGFRQLLRAHERRRPLLGAHEFHLELGERGLRLFRLSTDWIGETGQICACIDDLTEQRAVERHLQREEKQLLLDTLVGGIAHELNNKLTPVLGFAQLIEMEVGERARTYTGHIGKSVEEAAAIIRQLLQISKPVTGQPEPVNLGRLVDEAVTMLKFQLRDARVSVHTLAPPAAVTVFADPAQLKQIVMNLAINALHAMADEPDPRLRLQISRRDGVGCLEVSDNGCGIAPEIIERIFDPFFTTKAPDKGTGLGLSISQRLVQQMGGQIAVRSRPGHGACFAVSLPLAAVDAGASPLAPAGAGLVERPTTGPVQRVLVAEDEEVVRKFLQEALRAGFGCSVQAARNGAEALRMAEKEDFALVISDVRMAGMNGPEFYRRLGELRPEMADRFVFVTGHEGEAGLRVLLAQCQVPLLTKPFTMERLQEVCGPILQQSRVAP